MESYDITNENITDWAVNYASYDELKSVAKILYAFYKERQLTEEPEQYAKVEKYKIHKNKLKKAEKLSRV